LEQKVQFQLHFILVWRADKQAGTCPHLVAAAEKIGMKVEKRRPYIRSLTQLRQNQRPDKKAGKSGKKSGRPGNHNNMDKS
jgi:hypothetical protein